MPQECPYCYFSTMNEINSLLPNDPSWVQLRSFMTETQRTRSILNLLSWDQETFMPGAIADERAAQIEMLSAMCHAKICSDELGKLIEQCQSTASNERATALLHQLQRDRDHALRIPAELNRKLAFATSKAQQAWVSARQNKDPKPFLPYLAEIFELKRAEAACFAGDPYEVLLDSYEPGLKTAELDALFADLGPFLSDWTAQLAKVKFPELKGPFSIDNQLQMGNVILGKMGFNFDAGRLDQSAHPFSMGLHPLDVRLTARYREDCLEDGLFSIMHEGGHGLYEQGLPADLAWSPLGEALSLGIHESQSRFWENQIGRNRSFWSKNYAQMREWFPTLPADLDSFYGAIHKVSPSLIRVDADEVTYNLHVQLRYELEKSLFNGQIGVNDLEEAWNDKLMTLLGIAPAHAFEGYLQDVHWSAGLVGYFPTYTIGNLASAQWTEAMEAELGSLASLLENDKEIVILDWLCQHVHHYGRQFSAQELLQKATGKTLSSTPFKTYIEQKYSTFLS